MGFLILLLVLLHTVDSSLLRFFNRDDSSQPRSNADRMKAMSYFKNDIQKMIDAKKRGDIQGTDEALNSFYMNRIKLKNAKVHEAVLNDIENSLISFLNDEVNDQINFHLFNLLK